MSSCFRTSNISVLCLAKIFTAMVVFYCVPNPSFTSHLLTVVITVSCLFYLPEGRSFHCKNFAKTFPCNSNKRIISLHRNHHRRRKFMPQQWFTATITYYYTSRSRVPLLFAITMIRATIDFEKILPQSY